MALIKSKEFHTRYFTHRLIFPDGDEWVDQTPFIHDLQFQLTQTAWRNDLKKCNDLLTKGETKWKDHNGVTHLVRIDDHVIPRVWGAQKNLESLGQSKSLSRAIRRRKERERAKGR
jgi:hypothetical protein